MTEMRFGYPLIAGSLFVLSACGSAGDEEPAVGGLPSSAVPAATPAGGVPGSAMEPAGGEPRGSGGASQPAGAGSGESADEQAPLTVEDFAGVEDYDRGPGMPIGQEAGEEEAEGEESGETGEEALPEGGGNDDLEIPVFEAPEDTGPPCSGCIELSVHLDSPNQQAAFSFNAGGVNVTRVVWNLILPKNEDQLFIRTNVNGGDGPYRQTLANAFPVVGAPFEYVHEQGEGNVWSGNANQVGLTIGSSGGWARNERMRVFVESVVLEGAAGASRTFDSGTEGVVATTTVQDPQVTFHP